jgi:membrane complex biogenesis BtpA family protein
MLHAPPLPGSPRYGGDLDAAVRAVLADADALVTGGVPALLLENFGDAPFLPRRVPAETVAALTRLAVEVRRRFDVPLGINVLRSDGESAVAIAAAAGAAFVRINVLCGARVTDQGVIEGRAHRVLRLRRGLGAQQIAVLADVDVKHSVPLAPRPLEEEVVETIERGGADGIIVSGAATGRATSVEQVHRAKACAGTTPIFVGSGVTAETLPGLWPHADGFIVGTAMKRRGVVTEPVEIARVEAMLRAFRACGSAASTTAGDASNER